MAQIRFEVHSLALHHPFVNWCQAKRLQVCEYRDSFWRSDEGYAQLDATEKGCPIAPQLREIQLQAGAQLLKQLISSVFC